MAKLSLRPGDRIFKGSRAKQTGQNAIFVRPEGQGLIVLLPTLKVESKWGWRKVSRDWI